MPPEDADELIAFEHVRVVRSTPTALECAIGSKRVWLPREHIRGRLWRRGDCGTLQVRRWIVRDRHLAMPENPLALRVVCEAVPAPRAARRLHLLRPRIA